MGMKLSRKLDRPGDWACLNEEEIRLVENALRLGKEERSTEEENVVTLDSSLGVKNILSPEVFWGWYPLR